MLAVAYGYAQRKSREASMGRISSPRLVRTELELMLK
jgi:hypothetical protein